LFTGTDNSQNGGGPQAQLSRLVCLSADGGKTVWTSARGSLSNWNFLGTPILSGTLMYACAYHSGNGNMELHLLCIAPATGELQWETTIGSPTQVGNP
jgi:outer membrane protein assembly factor BamB